MENINISNLRATISQRVRERLDCILLLINSDKTNEEKTKLLRRKYKKDLRKVIDLIEDVRKTFAVLSRSGKRKIFHLNEFESRNKDHIDKNNLIRIYLREQPRLPTIVREPLWFEALLQCLVLGRLPLYWPTGDKVDTNFYKKFTVKELKQVLSGEIENPLEIWDSIEYAEGRSVSVSNLIRLYNLRFPNTLWDKDFTNTTLEEIQKALGIQVPIKKDLDGIDKDVIIYYMIITGDRETEMAHIKSSIIYERLGFTRPPQTIRELFNMDTQAFNNNRNFVRRELARRWREIPNTYGDDNENFAVGISRKIKYCYTANNIRSQHPGDDLTYTSNINDLLLVLQVIERDFE